MFIFLKSSISFDSRVSSSSVMLTRLFNSSSSYFSCFILTFIRYIKKNVMIKITIKNKDNNSTANLFSSKNSSCKPVNKTFFLFLCIRLYERLACKLRGKSLKCNRSRGVWYFYYHGYFKSC